MQFALIAQVHASACRAARMPDLTTDLTCQPFPAAQAQRAAAVSFVKFVQVRKVVALITPIAALRSHAAVHTRLVVSNDIKASAMLRAKILPQVKECL